MSSHQSGQAFKTLSEQQLDLKYVQNVCTFGKVKTLSRSGVVDLPLWKQVTASIEQLAFDSPATAQRHAMLLKQDHWLNVVEVLRDEAHQFKICLEALLRADEKLQHVNWHVYKKLWHLDTCFSTVIV